MTRDPTIRLWAWLCWIGALSCSPGDPHPLDPLLGLADPTGQADGVEAKQETQVFWSGKPSIRVEETADGFVIEFAEPVFELAQRLEPQAPGQGFLELRAAGYEAEGEVGLPALPVYSFDLAVDAQDGNAQVENLQIERSEVRLLHPVWPQQMPWPLSLPSAQRPFSWDRAHYQTHGAEAPVVRVESPFNMGGVSGVTIKLSPFAYDPVEHRLRITRGRVRVKIVRGEARYRPIPESFSQLYRKVFLNFQPAFYGAPATAKENYLVIAPPEFVGALDGFVQFRQLRGMNVEVVSTDTAGKTKEAIKAFLQQRYLDPAKKPVYVLLAGDTNLVPHATSLAQDGAANRGKQIPTDHDYALLEGNDLAADVFIGRWPVRTAQELEAVIQKTIGFERDLKSVPKQSLMVGGPDQMFTSCHNAIKPIYTQGGFTPVRHLCADGATSASFSERVNKGEYRFVHLLAHGYPGGTGGCCAFDGKKVRALQNTRYPVIFSHSCTTCPYDQTEAFCETWLRHKSGSVAYTGSSVIAYFPNEQYMAVGFTKARFEEKLMRLGAIVAYAKKYENRIQSRGIGRDYVFQINLMGDPALSTDDSDVQGPDLSGLRLQLDGQATDQEAPLFFTINGADQAPQADGSFGFEKDLAQPESAFVLEAQDPSGNRTQAKIVIQKK